MVEATAAVAAPPVRLVSRRHFFSITIKQRRCTAYDSNTDYCFKSKTADEYCWYPTDSLPEGQFWKGVDTQGNNNCGPKCTSVNDDDDGAVKDDDDGEDRAAFI